jgi:hypothetical protein
MDEQKKVENCESCGMPLDEKTVSKHNIHYCIYCQEQDTGRLKTFEEVKQGCIGATVKLMGKTEEEAKKMVEDMLPKLPRWTNGR